MIACKVGGGEGGQYYGWPAFIVCAPPYLHGLNLLALPPPTCMVSTCCPCPPLPAWFQPTGPAPPYLHGLNLLPLPRVPPYLHGLNLLALPPPPPHPQGQEQRWRRRLWIHHPAHGVDQAR